MEAGKKNKRCTHLSIARMLRVSSFCCVSCSFRKERNRIHTKTNERAGVRAGQRGRTRKEKSLIKQKTFFFFVMYSMFKFDDVPRFFYYISMKQSYAIWFCIGIHKRNCTKTHSISCTLFSIASSSLWECHHSKCCWWWFSFNLFSVVVASLELLMRKT